VGPKTPGLTAQEGILIKAAVSMGDPRFVPGTSYDAGTNKNKGGVSNPCAKKSLFIDTNLTLK
jgi:hypothetical protein